VAEPFEQRSPSWAAAVLAAAAVALVPWTVALTVILPSRHLADHWDLAWTGFDVVLACSLLATAAAAARSRRAVQPLAAASAALLFCDAWFDVLTASSGIDLEVAILLAVLAEIPLALVCLLLASGRAGPSRQGQDRLGVGRFRIL